MDSEQAPVAFGEHHLLRALINALPDQIYVKDDAGRFVLVNTAVERFFGVASEAQVLQKTDFDFFPVPTAQSFSAEDRGILEQHIGEIHREACIRDADGRERWVLTSKVPLPDESGRVVGLVGINRDITSVKRTEENLRQALDEVHASHARLQAMQLELIEAAKMKSIGRLAAGIAHEVKNPLGIISLGADYLLGRVAKEDPAVLAVCREMKAAVSRADAVIRGLLDFAAPRKLNLTTANLNGVIEQSLALVRHEVARARAGLVLELDTDLPPVQIDANKIEQVFVNAMTNALHAMALGGTLTVRTYATAWNGEPSPPHPAALFEPNDTIVVAEIDDTGPGLPHDQLAHVFDPFYTTKSSHQGTGLGLTISRAIVALHCGSIDLANKPGGGARLTVKLKTAAGV